MNVKDVNKTIKDCISNFNSKLDLAATENIYVSKVSGVEEVAWKLIDCLVENEICDQSVRLAKYKVWKHAKKESIDQCYSQRGRGRTLRQGEKQRRSKSLPCIHKTDYFGSRRDSQKRIEVNDDDDGYNHDDIIAPTSHACEGIKAYHKLELALNREKKLKNTIEHIELKLKEETNELTQCQEEKSNAISNYARYVIENNRLKIHVEKLEREEQNKNRQAQEQIDQLKREMKEKETDLDKSVKCIHKQNHQLEEIQEEREKWFLRSRKLEIDIRAENENLKISLKGVKEDLENSINRSRKFEIDCITLHKTKTENEDLKSSIETVKGELRQSVKRSKTLESNEVILQTMIKEREVLKTSLDTVKRELRDLKKKSRKLQTDLTNLPIMKDENENLRTSLEEMKTELDNSEKRCKNETLERKCSENVSIKYKNDYDSQETEINKLRKDLETLQSKTDKSLCDSVKDIDMMREDLEKQKREKTELIALFRDEKDKESQNINGLKLEIGSLKSRDASSTSKVLEVEREVKELKRIIEDQEKEIKNKCVQLETLDRKEKELEDHLRDASSTSKELEVERKVEELKEIIKDQKKEIRNKCAQLETLDRKEKELEDKLRDASSTNKVLEVEKKVEELNEIIEDQKKEIRNKCVQLETLDRKENELEVQFRLCEELARTSKHSVDVRTGSMRRAQTLVQYDQLLEEKCRKIGDEFLQLYKKEWKYAMTELNKSEDEKENIEFLLKIIERAYLFTEHTAPRFEECFQKALLSISSNIQAVVDTALLIRELLEPMTDCIKQMFLKDHDSLEYVTRGPAVHTFIGEAVTLCWLMVIQNPRVLISTTIPTEFPSKSFEPYRQSQLDTVDYVVWPVVSSSKNENAVLCKGIAAFK